MKYLSFDVGIKNLAYCLLDSEDLSINDWGILNISVDSVCEHQIKGRQCENTAKKMIKDTGFRLCTSHCKIKQYKDLKMKTIPKLKNPMFELGKSIIKKLNEKPNFLHVDQVCIENQPALKNPTMKSVQMILYSYFLMNGSMEDIQMMNARNKLKVYKGPYVICPYEDNKKNKYKINKYLAIKYCKYMIEENEKIDKKFHELYDSSKKKDDLSDAYLQGMFVLTKITK